jgi:hypothetical protein
MVGHFSFQSFKKTTGDKTTSGVALPSGQNVTNMVNEVGRFKEAARESTGNLSVSDIKVAMPGYEGPFAL